MGTFLSWAAETVLASDTELRHILRKRKFRQFQVSAFCQFIQKHTGYCISISYTGAPVKNHNLHQYFLIAAFCLVYILLINSDEASCESASSLYFRYSKTTMESWWPLCDKRTSGLPKIRYRVSFGQFMNNEQAGAWAGHTPRGARSEGFRGTLFYFWNRRLYGMIWRRRPGRINPSFHAWPWSRVIRAGYALYRFPESRKSHNWIGIAERTYYEGIHRLLPSVRGFFHKAYL